MKIFALVTALFLMSFLTYSEDWGATGHRATGEIAEKYIKKKARKKISKILQGQSLALASTFADEIKSDKQYRKYNAWHYVNIDEHKKYGDDEPNPYGDLVTGIDHCIKVLKDKNSTFEEQNFHLKLLIHFIGDLHMPLHVGHKEDKGGNDLQVRWFDKGTNLHRVWDSDMLDHYGMSYTELASNTEVLLPEDIKKIQAGNILDWVHESQQLATKVYASAEIGEKLSYRYMYDHFETLRKQLQKGGIRLAKILNDIYC